MLRRLDQDIVEAWRLMSTRRRAGSAGCRLLDRPRGGAVGGCLPAESGEAIAHDPGHDKPDSRRGAPQQSVGPREPGFGGVERRRWVGVLADGAVSGPEELLDDERAQEAAD